jgi:DNA adenine methylase
VRFDPMAPVEPVAPYIGGKRNLARRIAARLQAQPHDTYVEVFVGMGGVFFRRPFKAKAEVINDASADVSNLFRILQRHLVPLMDMLRWQVTSREEFERLRGANPDSLTDLERACRFLYLQRTAFGGKVASRNFGVNPTGSARFDTAKLLPMLEAVHERLSGVVIERLAWSELLARYDRPGTLFYLDPPYWGCEGDYGKELFGRGQFELMAEQLAGLQGNWLLSLNDVPEVRRIFGRFRIEGVETSYSIAGGGRRDGGRVAEVLISPRAANLATNS